MATRGTVTALAALGPRPSPPRAPARKAPRAWDGHSSPASPGKGHAASAATRGTWREAEGSSRLGLGMSPVPTLRPWLFIYWNNAQDHTLYKKCDEVITKIQPGVFAGLFRLNSLCHSALHKKGLVNPLSPTTKFNQFQDTFFPLSFFLLKAKSILLLSLTFYR